MEFLDTAVEYWPVVLVVLASALAILKAVAKKTKNTTDDKVAEVLEDALDAIDGDE